MPTQSPLRHQLWFEQRWLFFCFQSSLSLPETALCSPFKEQLFGTLVVISSPFLVQRRILKCQSTCLLFILPQLEPEPSSVHHLFPRGKFFPLKALAKENLGSYIYSPQQQSYEVRELRKNDWPKNTQLPFMPKAQTSSIFNSSNQFLGQNLHHHTAQTGLVPFWQ